VHEFIDPKDLLQEKRLLSLHIYSIDLFYVFRYIGTLKKRRHVMEVQNIRAYLANIGMTLKDFSESIGTTPTYISAIDKGTKRASARLAKDICAATNGIIKLKTRVRKKNLKGKEQQEEHNQQQNEAGTQ